MKLIVLYPYNKLQEFLNRGHERSVLAKKNISASLVIKGLDVGISFLMVPLILNYLDQTRYGIWLTMTSLVAWFGFMDVGLGNGLRNKFAEAKAKGEHEKAKIYVSTTYAILIAIVLVFFSLFLIINNYIPWYKVLNVKETLNTDLSILSIIVFGSFSLKFVAQLINTLYVADQRPAIRDGTNFIGRLFVFIVIYLLTKTAKSSLLYLGITYTFLPIIVIILLSFYSFNGTYSRYKPSIKYINIKYGKDLIGLGWKFFIIQIALVIILSTDNIIITQLFNPSMVTPYQIARKYFSISFMFFMIIMTPIWSASTEAFANKDAIWVKKTVGKLKSIVIVFSIFSLIMFIFSGFIYQIWIGGNIQISYTLSFIWMLFFVIQMYNAIYFHIINGSGKVKAQMIVYTIAMLLNIPLSIIFAKYLKFGISGVILASVFCQLLHTIYLPFQYKLIVKNKTYGIWDS